MTFNNVVVPTSGLYTVDWRYAFQGGLFPGVNNRQMGLIVNGVVITYHQSFPITGSFDVYQHSALQVHLNAGVNSISQLAVSDHGLSRVDQLTVTPATASVPGEPTNLRATPGNTTVTLTWNASPSGSPTSYRIYRGTKSDGEVNTPVARWSSAFSDPQWLQVDLGATHSISRVVLDWQTAYGRAFQIQTSTNGTTWTTIYTTTTGAGGAQDLAITGSGRYIRMYGTQRATQYGYSLREFQVYGV